MARAKIFVNKNAIKLTFPHYGEYIFSGEFYGDFCLIFREFWKIISRSTGYSSSHTLSVRLWSHKACGAAALRGRSPAFSCVPARPSGIRTKEDVKAVECTAALLPNIILMWHVSALMLFSCPSLVLLEVISKAIRWHLTLHLANLSSSVNCVKFEEVRPTGQLFPWSLPQITSIIIFALVLLTVVSHSYLLTTTFYLWSWS